MKKLFIAETGEEVQMGETLELDLSKKTEKGAHKFSMEVTLNPAYLPLLLDAGILVEKDTEEEDKPEGCEQECSEEFPFTFGEEEEGLAGFFQALMEDFEDLEKKVEALSAEVKELSAQSKTFSHLTYKYLTILEKILNKATVQE